MLHKTQIDTDTAAEFLNRCFSPNETIAIVLRRVCPARIIQRIVTLERALQPRYLAWLGHENAAGANVYVAVNPLLNGVRGFKLRIQVEEMWGEMVGFRN
jgi:hypothetical protein